MRKLLSSRSEKRGLPPGTPVYIGEKKLETPQVTLIDYDETEFLVKHVERIQDCFPFKDKPTVSWIDISSIHDLTLIRSLAEGFGLHPLVQEDILNTDQRPKMVDFGEYLYLVLKMLQWDEAGGQAVTEQVSLILGPNFVISLQERQGDLFNPIRDRIRIGKARIRKMQADYLAYSLVDAIVDGYFFILEKTEEKIELIEAELLSKPNPDTVHRIHRMRREIMFLRKSIWPLREVIGSLARSESSLISDATNIYLRDVYDHIIQVIDTAEMFRNMLAGMLDIYLSSVNNRMNEVMKALTVIATIFIPLTFIAGVYGMNFQYMPELPWRWGYAMALALMAAVAIGMIFFIRKKKWF